MGEKMAVDKNIQILIVDDYQTMRHIVRNLLGQLGFKNIDEAKDGGEALVKVKSKQYELIISDWNMAPMSGIELLEHTRKLDAYKKTPFVMVTAENTMANIVQAKQLGATNYIVKPFTAEVLRTKLEAIFGPF